MYITRFLEKEVSKYLGRKEIIAVIGPRQSGKTTLLRHFFEKCKNAVFLDFEDRQTLELFSEDVDSFIELHVKKHDYVFIDEFQYAKEGGKNLKHIYDSCKTKMIISGSSASELSIQSIKYLVGRIFVFTLYPFSFEEYLNYKNENLYRLSESGHLSKQVIDRIMPHFNEFCVYGGYPRVALAEDKPEKEVVLRNIYNTYLLKEIKEILNLPEDYKLSKLIHALSLQIGGIVNYKELSDITGFNHKDLLKHINVLEKTFVLARSLPYHTNKRTELVKAPKAFFLDSGFRNAVIRNFQPIENRPDKGNLYENFVASELLKAGVELKYWRTKSMAEVDFVIEKNGNLMPIEIKSNLARPNFTKSFTSFLEKYKPKKPLILSEKLFAEKNKTRFRPIFCVQNEI
ncbi:MAG TPA: ATP-binding protein [Candidatus Nanoarchaeia archaeon]|nr:ATP-binding protein [Candidatus Nanoarchaeia archaeon]